MALLLRNRALRQRPGNVPVRVRPAEKKRWSPGHGVWIHDVFAFRGLPAGWKESLVWVTGAAVRPASEEERKKLHRIGDDPVIIAFTRAEGEKLEVAARRENADDLLGPFANRAQPGATGVSALTSS
ncbi:MAG: hypothetical protein ABI323_12425 [Solirubrobacteraceae bacterium]